MVVALFPIFLSKAGRSGTYKDAFLVGVFFTLTAAFYYWFYGLFAAMFGLVWLVAWIWKDRPPRSILLRFLTMAGTTALFGCLLFLMPYFAADEQSNQSEALPEVTFFLSIQVMIPLLQHHNDLAIIGKMFYLLYIVELTVLGQQTLF